MKSYGFTLKVHTLTSINENITFLHELVKPPDSARRAPWTEEKEESASHHWLIIICFARAKNMKKDLPNPPETAGNHENIIF